MVFSLLYNIFTKSLMVLLVAMLSVNYLDGFFKDFPFEPKSMEPHDFESVVPEWNTKLSNGEYIQLNNIFGPESIAISKDGLLYTGLADGRIVELDPNKNYKLRQVLRFKKSVNCGDNVINRASECGRFLQLRFVNNTLYALESNTGLYKVDVKTGAKSLVGPIKQLNQVNLYNSFAFDPKKPNIVYLTVSSTKWKLETIVWSVLELDASGQIIAIDTNTGKRAVVLDNLLLANGLDVDVRRDQLILSESSRSQVSAIPLKDVRAAFESAKDGDLVTGTIKKTALIRLLPGHSDNIIIEGDIAYIALPFVKPNGKDLVDHTSSMPSVRKAFGRLIYMAGKILEYVCGNFYSSQMLEGVSRDLKSGYFNYMIVNTEKSAMIEYNLATGASRFFGSDTFSFLSEVVPDNKGNLFLGSFKSPFIVKVKI